ncbi:S-phase kinase-associated protein 2-like isoform X2 [Porites lutea]|uniref:S-phase kinase-associated protein 2-like isoform X2 n=1 Tax=Porites lutea TaxID=51062 RepID=UPI003CC5363B
MDSLPDDIWLEVFSFLSQEDLLRAALVCRTWKRLSRDSSLWSYLDLQPYARSLREDIILRLLNTMFAPLGRQLSLSKNLVTTEILKTIFETCHRLQSLSLNNSRFHSIGPWLERTVDQVETLIFLDLRNASGFAAGIEDILQKAYNLKYLVLPQGLPAPPIFYGKSPGNEVFTVVSVLDCLEAFSAENTSSVS